MANKVPTRCSERKLSPPLQPLTAAPGLCSAPQALGFLCPHPAAPPGFWVGKRDQWGWEAQGGGKPHFKEAEDGEWG